MKKNKKEIINIKETLFSDENSFKTQVPYYLDEISNNNEFFQKKN